jgi:hypothetical protein
MTWDWFDLNKVEVTAVIALVAGRLSKLLDRRLEHKDAAARASSSAGN